MSALTLLDRRSLRELYVGFFLVGAFLYPMAAGSVKALDPFFWEYDTGGEVELVCLSADGNYIAVLTSKSYGAEKEVFLIKNDGSLLWNKSISTNAPDDISVSRDASYVVTNRDQEISVYNREGQILWEKDLLDGFDTDIEVSSNGKYIVAGDGKSVRIFNMSGEQLWKHELGAWVHRVSVSSDGERIAAACEHEEIYVFDDKGTLLWSYKLNMSYFSSIDKKIICVSPNGDYLVAATFGETSLLCLDADGNVIWSEPYPPSDAISASENRIALVSLGGLLFLDRNGTEYSEYSGNVGKFQFNDVAISADGRFACAAGNNGCIYFLEILKSRTIFLTLDKGNWEIIPGEMLSITVSLDPPGAGEDVTLTITNPNGTTLSKVVTTSTDGSCTEKFTPDVAGNWTIKASWLGDENYWGDESTRLLTVGAYPVRIGEEAYIKVYGGVSFLYDYDVIECPVFIHYSCRAVFVIGGSSYVSHWIRPYPSAKVGIYDIKVDGDGIPDFYRRIEVLPPLAKYDTQVSINISKSEVASGSEMAVDGVAYIMEEGNLTAYEDLEIKLNYAKPNGETLTRIVTTDRKGEFHDSSRFSEEGVWNVTAVIPEDYARNLSQSQTLTFTVKPSFSLPFNFPTLLIIAIGASAGVIIFSVAMKMRRSRKSKLVR